MHRALLLLFFAAGCGAAVESPPDSGPDAARDVSTADAVTDVAQADASPDAPTAPTDAGTFACGTQITCKRFEEYCLHLDANWWCRPLPPECRSNPSCSCPNLGGTGMCGCVQGGPDLIWRCQA